ncbi:hypothetical protein Dimus_021747 [Dionaea muscipula]
MLAGGEAAIDHHLGRSGSLPATYVACEWMVRLSMLGEEELLAWERRVHLSSSLGTHELTARQQRSRPLAWRPTEGRNGAASRHGRYSPRAIARQAHRPHTRFVARPTSSARWMCGRRSSSRCMAIGGRMTLSSSCIVAASSAHKICGSGAWPHDTEGKTTLYTSVYTLPNDWNKDEAAMTTFYPLGVAALFDKRFRTRD